MWMLGLQTNHKGIEKGLSHLRKIQNTKNHATKDTIGHTCNRSERRITTDPLVFCLYAAAIIKGFLETDAVCLPFIIGCMAEATPPHCSPGEPLDYKTKKVEDSEVMSNREPTSHENEKRRLSGDTEETLWSQ